MRNEKILIKILDLFSSTDPFCMDWFLSLVGDPDKKSPLVSIAMSNYFNSTGNVVYALDIIEKLIGKINSENCFIDIVSAISDVLNKISVTSQGNQKAVNLLDTLAAMVKSKYQFDDLSRMGWSDVRACISPWVLKVNILLNFDRFSEAKKTVDELNEFIPGARDEFMGLPSDQWFLSAAFETFPEATQRYVEMIKANVSDDCLLSAMSELTLEKDKN